MEEIKTTASKYKTQPLRHQLDCLLAHGRKQAFALLSEMGTGKSWIIINNLADLWSSSDCDAAFVLAPNGVHTNWTRIEIIKHMPDWVRYYAAAWTANPNKKEKFQLERLYENAGSGELRIFTMNWEALQTKKGFAAAERFLNTCRAPMIVCDESDSAKNPKAERTKALMKLKKYSVPNGWRRIMSGTPVNNGPFDIFAPFTFLDENILGTDSYFAFKAEYAELMTENHHLIRSIVKKKTKMDPQTRGKIETDMKVLGGLIFANKRDELIECFSSVQGALDDEDWDHFAERLQTLKGMFVPNASKKRQIAMSSLAGIEGSLAGHLRKVSSAYHPNRLPQIVEKDKEGLPRYKNLDKLSALIAPHSFRVLKKDCLDLPDKIYKTVIFEMTKEQEEIYIKAKEECRIVFEGNETPFNKLVAVTKLSQITSGYYIHPMAEEPVRIPGENPKLEMLIDRVNAIMAAGEKVIIWARYRIEIQDIVDRLKKEGLTEDDIVEYHGGIKKNERSDGIESFERGDARIFVGNQQAGGTGITLVAASNVIYFSNDYSLRNRLQSEDRAHRIGQTKNVNYLNIVAKDTIDEAVVLALTNKKGVADIIIDVGLKYFKET